MGLERIALKIRKREGFFYNALYQMAVKVRRVHFPVIRPLHRALFYERRFRKSSWHTIKRVCYFEPLFKSVCRQVGTGLCLINGIPWIEGDLDIYIGNDVTINGITTFSGATVWEKPSLYIGDRTYIGHQGVISVGPLVKIGRDVLIADRVHISGYDGHPLDPVERMKHRPARKEDGKPVMIGDNVWICFNATILKGVTIGEGAIVGAHAVVTSDVPPYAVVAGNPAREVKRLTPPLVSSGLQEQNREAWSK